MKPKWQLQQQGNKKHTESKQSTTTQINDTTRMKFSQRRKQRINIRDLNYLYNFTNHGIRIVGIRPEGIYKISKESKKYRERASVN
jgi:hypothetical protein